MKVSIMRKKVKVSDNKMLFEPGYLEIDLKDRIDQLYTIMESCELCPRKCGVNRLDGEEGYCRSGEDLIVSSIHPHFGEEEPLVGMYGSGTIFLCNCNLGCIYCQNYEISHFGNGTRMSATELAIGMIRLQKMGCHNINLVTPTHFVPQLVKSIKIAAEKGLRIPIVYNCGGYERKETLELLEGIIDIYMPDIKYSDRINAKKYSNAQDYFDICREAVKEMYAQVGDLKIENRIAEMGLLIRHLVLPNGISGSKEVLRFISELSKESYVNIMAQYRPMYRAYEYEELSRPVKISEYRSVMRIARGFGLHRGFDL